MSVTGGYSACSEVQIACGRVKCTIRYRNLDQATASRKRVVSACLQLQELVSELQECSDSEVDVAICTIAAEAPDAHALGLLCSLRVLRLADRHHA